MKENKKYDFLIVGSGLFGSTCANLLSKKGYKVLVLEKRKHVGGNIYTKRTNGIDVHVYGAHIFHTSDENIWSYINQFGKFNNFINSPLANYKGELYHLPFNLNTFIELWPDVRNGEDAKAKIEAEKHTYGIISEPSNLEEQAIMLVGTTIYEKLIKGYTEKQWHRKCSELPAFIIKRIPLRFEKNNNYFNDVYQGIPLSGYTSIIKNMLKGIDVRLGVDFLANKEKYEGIAGKIIFTGSIDEYFGYKFGILEYRSLEFKNELLNQKSFQNNAVINYTSSDEPYTRIIEHKFFNFKNTKTTIITREFPKDWEIGGERFYPINNDKNNDLYLKYHELANSQDNVYFGGRLGMYKYFDMDDTIDAAFKLVNKLIEEK